MAKLSHTDSRRMYSWWWDSHISPKNSKWLQQNLTDMDVKVKSMIKLIEVDEDSFARRAEMYYKKRPELMKMVEEFYRAYRALAERYDHATGVIRHAHRTMSEAFPNQLPTMFADESPASSVSGYDPSSPDSPNKMGEFIDESDNVSERKIFKLFNGSFGPLERVRRGLHFDEAEDKEENVFSNGNDDVNDLKSLKLDQESDSKEIIALKEAIVKLESEKEAGFAKYQQTLDKLSQLETEISKTREDFSVLRNHATISDTEVSALKDALAMLEAEKESKLQDYQKCLDKISMLQTTVSTAEDDAQKLNERANSAEMKAQSLKTELDELAVEKEAALNQYIQSLEIILNLENKLRLSEEDSTGLKERAEKAESEVNSLRRAISKLTEEKETAVLQYRHCLETICNLEKKLTFANEEAKRLNGEKENEVTKLLGAKEQCLMLERSNQSLHSELESLTLKMGAQSQELTEKQKELGRLLNCVQEERLRFVDAETAFQTLQHLHTQTQEEMRAMVSELQNRAQLLKVAETQKQSLQDEFLRVMEENKHLDDLNSSSALSIKDMQNEICSLTQSKEKLEEEVEQRLDERNALQQEIYCLKEELNDLRKKHLSDLEQVHSVGLNPEFLRKSVKELQEENSNLKETCQRESIDKAALMKKLEILDHLLEKNSLLETSLADLNAELDVVRGKIEELEKSCQSLMKEKSTLLNEKEKLMTQLQETNKKLEKLLENKTVLENSLSDAHLQLEALKAKSKILEDSCHLLVNDKADLICEKDGLTSQLEKTQKRLIDFEKLHGELEGRCEHLENVKESALRKVEELQMSMEIEKQNHASQIEMSRAQLTEFESEKHVLREECQQRKRELELVLDGAIASEIEIFILRTTSHVLKENNCSLVTKNQILLEKSSLSEKDISRLEQCNIEQHSKIRSLSDHFSCMRSGTRQLLNVFSIAEDCGSADTVELDQVYLNQLSIKLHHLKETLCEAEDINLEHSVALSVLVTWIKELGLHLNNVEVEKCKIDREFKIKSEQVLRLQSDTITLLEMNEELTSKLREGDCNKEALIIQIENLNAKLTDIEDTCQDFQRENEGLKTQLAAFGPEIVLLKECISSLEGQTGIHIKFQIPESEELQGSEGSQNPPESILNEDKKMLMPVSDVHDSRVRLQAIVKAADEMKELMVQENIDLRSKLDESTRKIELLQSESRKHRRNRRPTSEITEEDDALLTKDIVLDQISDGSYRYSKKEVANVDNEIVELWETADPDGTVGLSLSKSNKIVSPSTSKTVGFHRSRSTRRQKGGFGISDGLNEEDLSVDKLEISKRSTDSFQEGNRRKVLERLDSDVQRLANLQITVQDLKRKLEVTEKDKRGKTVIECETLKRQLGEADTAVMKLFDLNGRLKNSIDDMSFSDTKTSFDFEGEDGGKRRKVSEQARRMSEKIGRLQLEVQKLQFVLLKLDDENEGRSRMSETKRRILLRDYLYGGGRTGQRPKKSQFCVCVQPSPVEE